MSEQGEFARGYVRALAAAAGLRASDHVLARDGVDIGLRFPATVFPVIEAQVAWCVEPAEVAGEWCFDGLDEERFNLLAGDAFTVPRYLFLLVLPDDGEYCWHRSDGMLLRHLGYFHSLRNEAPLRHPDRARRRPVYVPKPQVLTVPRLQKLMRGVE